MGGRGGSSRSAGNKATRMPELTGSEKQVSWAKDIRKNVYGYLDSIEEALKRKDNTAFLKENAGGKSYPGGSVRLYEAVRDESGRAKRGPNGERIKEFTIDQKAIQNVRKDLNKFFKSESEKSASKIIEKRDDFNSDNIERLLKNDKKKRKK